jgi:hypothetical protein
MAPTKNVSRPQKSPMLLMMILFIVLGVFINPAAGLTQALCSTQNTGSGSGGW